jgi:hypothetical protein
MPIEIRELVIRAVVTESASDPDGLHRALASMKQEIVEECRERLQELVLRSNDR